MMKKLSGVALCLALWLVPGLAMAQSATITGTVTDDQGEPLIGAQVAIQAMTLGAATDINGRYSFEVPAARVNGQTVVLEVRYIGFQTASRQITLTPGTQIQDFELAPDLLGLDEVIVTGVAVGTPTKKLGFSISKVSGEALEEVPAPDPASALRGKVAGVSIIQASGDPSQAASIRLRGSTTINGSQEPLIIIDGVITDGSLRDINMEDVESIEVVKGAAAASLYGSLAGNGVIQIRTKRGAQGAAGPQVKVRSEFGFSQISREYPLATKHPWVVDELTIRLPDGSTQDFTFTGNESPSELEAAFASIPEGSKILSWTGRSQGAVDPDRRFENPFPVLYDNIDAVFTGQPFNSNYVSVGSATEQFNYLASFENYGQGGVLDPVDPYQRNTFRLNADYTPSERFGVKFSGSYITVDSPSFEEQGQGDNYFYSVLTMDPYMDLTEKNEDGTYSNKPTGYEVQASNWQNPLYVAEQREFSFQRDRLLTGFEASFAPTNWFSLHGRQSLDKSYVQLQTYYPKGYETPTPNSNINDGFDARQSETYSTAISELWAQFNQSFSQFNLTAIAKYLYEDRQYETFSASGSRYFAKGVRDIGGLDPETRNIDSYTAREKAENYFLNVDLDYAEKYILSGLIRRDGSSSFGADERWQTYYRGSIAYRLTEDFSIPNVQELKLRLSYGTSGQRPPFSAQYETYSVSSSGISPGILGNRNLKPSRVAELEAGLNLGFLNRFSFEANYAVTNVENDYLLVPLPAVAGFSAQWRNVGEIKSTALEFALSGPAISRSDFSWDYGLTFSRVTQEVTDLGGIPPFTRAAGGAIPLFRFEAGLPYGTMYGNEVLTSLDDLTLDANGNVLNAGIDTNGDGRLTRDDYEINQHGYVVPKGTHGTPDEQVVYRVDENGEKMVVSIGNTQPDFTLGFSSNLNYKGIGLYFLVDWVQGGEVYNYTKQLLYFNDRHKDLQDFAAQGFDYGYANGSSQIYNGADASSYFVEDASFIKLRELSLSYTLGRKQLGSALGNYVDRVKVSVIGRNLLTFTDYTGWDPEVALRTNATNFRLDEYAYPNYRTFTGAIELRF